MIYVINLTFKYILHIVIHYKGLTMSKVNIYIKNIVFLALAFTFVNAAPQIWQQELHGNKDSKNKIYMKLSGQRFNILIDSNDPNEKFSKVTCTITDSIGKITTENVSNSPTPGVFKHAVLIHSSGTNFIECAGIDDKGKMSTSPKIKFNTEPATYALNATFTAGLEESKVISSDQRAEGQLLKVEWFGSPIAAKIGDNFVIKLTGNVKNEIGKIDAGINSEMNNVNSIINNTALPTTCVVDYPKATFNNPKFKSGNFTDQVALKVDFKDVYESKIIIKYLNKTVYNRVSNAEKTGDCYKLGMPHVIGKIECPYPPTFEYHFDYLITPNNFMIGLKNPSKGNADIKTLYFGQGNSPSIEEKNTLYVAALDDKGAALKNFTSTCFAKDLFLELRYINSDYSIQLVDGNVNQDYTDVDANSFTANSMSEIKKTIKVTKKNGARFLPNEIQEPLSFKDFKKTMYFKGKKNNSVYPNYRVIIDPAIENIAILRGRINVIDADNAQNYNTMPQTKVIYEFFCKTCELDLVKKATGISNYTPSPTLAGWWIDETFSNWNTTSIKPANVESSGVKINTITNVSKGRQNIVYNNANKGKYQIKIKQNDRDGNAFPSFLLYNPYYENAITTWGTSAFLTIYEKITETSRDFGIDVGDSKNTRGSGRVGRF